MRKTIIACAAAALLLSSCKTAGVHTTGPINASARSAMFDRVKSLQGRWTMPDEKGNPSYTEFKLTANGSVLREIMFPGGDHEMTNMYHLDGDSTVVTHYCASGNQPRMRATGLNGNMLQFKLDSVSDLQSMQDEFMGEMALEFVDGDHLAQHWTTFVNGVRQPSFAFQWTRVK